MGDSFVTKRSVFENMPLSPAIKGSLDNSLVHSNFGATQDLLRNGKLNESKALSVKPASNTNLPTNINSPKQDKKPVIYEEPSPDQLMLQDVL